MSIEKETKELSYSNCYALIACATINYKEIVIDYR